MKEISKVVDAYTLLGGASSGGLPPEEFRLPHKPTEEFQRLIDGRKAVALDVDGTIVRYESPMVQAQTYFQGLRLRFVRPSGLSEREKKELETKLWEIVEEVHVTHHYNELAPRCFNLLKLAGLTHEICDHVHMDNEITPYRGKFVLPAFVEAGLVTRMEGAHRMCDALARQEITVRVNTTTPYMVAEGYLPKTITTNTGALTYRESGAVFGCELTEKKPNRLCLDLFCMKNSRKLNEVIVIDDAWSFIETSLEAGAGGAVWIGNDPERSKRFAGRLIVVPSVEKLTELA